MSDEIVTLEDDDQVLDVELENYNVPVQEAVIHEGTTAYWNAQSSLIAESGHIYAYTDYTTVEGNDSPGIKVGDGVTILSELPFVSGDTTVLDAHIANTVIHVTAAEKESWDNKVDPEEGKGLSENDFTDALKAKLEGIEAGAEVNVQSDWAETDTTADSFIQHKPEIPDHTSDLINDSGFITANEAPVQGVKGSAESAYRTGNVSVSKTDIGLGNVDNTSDLNKPISTAVQNALDLKANAALIGAANGIAELDSNGFVPAAQLPSYVDDILEFASMSAFPATGETGKIYVALDTNLTYRWGGSEYVEISQSLALGETSGTAYRGDRGKAAYDHSQLTSGNPHHVTAADVGLGNVDNTADTDKPVSTAMQAALNGKQNTLNWDNEPTSGSTNPVTSGGLYTLLSVVASEATALSIKTTETALSASIMTLLNRIFGAYPTSEVGDLIVQDLVDGNILLAQLAKNIKESGVF